MNTGLRKLEKDLIAKLAILDGVKPEKISLDYIEKQRTYRDEVLGLPMLDLSDDSSGLSYFTGKQWKKIGTISNKLLSMMKYN